MTFLLLAVWAYLCAKHIAHAVEMVRDVLRQCEPYIQALLFTLDVFQRRHHIKMLVVSILIDVAVGIHYGDSILDCVESLAACGAQ